MKLFDTDMFHALRSFLLLWSTQSLSSLGSAMTNFALVIWVYQQQGSALSASLLTICSYAPYVLLSMFAGALSDRWNKKATMLVSDSVAALCTVCVLVLLHTGRLQMLHLYLINALNGLMNTIQQPASDVAITLLCPPAYYQKVSGMRSFSQSLVTVLTPALATALLAFAGLQSVIVFDLATFLVAFCTLLCKVRIPQAHGDARPPRHSVWQSIKEGLGYLWEHRGILHLILFLAVINFTASIFQAALPAMILSRNGGSQWALGAVNTVTGIATMVGSVLATVLPAPKSRVRVICNCLLFSMSTENFLLAWGRTPLVWCIGAVLGWICIPMMNANMDVLLRANIPVSMQGRVYAARNSLQFFTIPLGYLCGGLLVDRVFEPFMARQAAHSVWGWCFGVGKGTGAACLFFVIGVFGALSCLPFRRDKHLWNLEKPQE